MRKLWATIVLALGLLCSSQPTTAGGSIRGGVGLCGNIISFCDPAAQALFAAQTASGYTPTTQWKNAANQLILGLKSGGYWSGADVLLLPVAGTLGASLPNWKSPGTYDLVPVYTDRPCFNAFRGLCTDGTSSTYNIPTYTPSVNGVGWSNVGLGLDAAMAVGISPATPARSSIQAITNSGTTGAGILVYGSSGQTTGAINDNNSTNPGSPLIFDATGITMLGRSGTGKYFTHEGSPLGTFPTTRAATAVANGIFNVPGGVATAYFPGQVQFIYFGAYSSIIGKDAAFTSLIKTFLNSVALPPTGGPYAGLGDSYVNGSGGSTNTALGASLNYYTGRSYTALAAGGTTLQQQANVVIANPAIYGQASVWWDGNANSHVSEPTDVSIINSAIAAGLNPAKTVFLTSIVIGPPNPGVTDVLLADMQNLYNNYVVPTGFKTFDVQAYLNSISPAGPSKSAGLVDPALSQGGGNIHLNAATMDLVTQQVAPLLNQINWLLKRDVDPVGHANDNSPMWLERAA
jgi:hypothetical protein